MHHLNVSSNKHKKSPKNSKGLTVLRTTLLATELVLGTMIAPATAVTLTAPGNLTEKVEAGLKAPRYLYALAMQIPEDIALFEKGQEAFEADWSLEKITTLTTIGIAETRKILNKEGEYIRKILQGKENFETMPIVTLEAAIIVISTYLILIRLLDLVRLGDRDSLVTRTRKKVWRALIGKTESDVIVELLGDGGKSNLEIQSILEQAYSTLVSRQQIK